MNEDKLEQQCERCAGNGRVVIHLDKSIMCPECRGSGEQVTPYGKRLLQFVSSHLKSVPVGAD